MLTRIVVQKIKNRLGMKLFEGIPTMSGEEAARELLTYVQLLQNYVRSGLVDQESFNSFPIYDAFQLVNKGMKERQKNRVPPTTLTLVVSACREDLRFLGLDVPHEIREKTRVAIVQKCGDFREKWQWVPMLYKAVDFVNVDDGALRGDECTAYLGYISQRYSTLSNYTIFVHADIREHVHFDEHSEHMMNLLMKNIYNGGWNAGFAHLTHNYDLRRWDGHPKLYRSLLNTRINPNTIINDDRLNMDGYCCSHFIVKRDRIHLRDRKWYDNALAHFRSEESYQQLPGTKFISKYDVRSRAPCQNMMALWQIVYVFYFI